MGFPLDMDIFHGAIFLPVCPRIETDCLGFQFR